MEARFAPYLWTMLVVLIQIELMQHIDYTGKFLYLYMTDMIIMYFNGSDATFEVTYEHLLVNKIKFPFQMHLS